MQGFASTAKQQTWRLVPIDGERFGMGSSSLVSLVMARLVVGVKADDAWSHVYSFGWLSG